MQHDCIVIELGMEKMMENKTPVSCIVPVYNGEVYLREFLDSLTGQTMEEIEIICVDDASTDSSLSIISEYQKRKDIIVIKNEYNMGAAETRNRGLRAASGKYVVFLDCDDILHPEMIADMYQNCQKADADLCICYLEYFTEDKHVQLGRFERDKALIQTYPVIQNPLNFQYLFQVINNGPTDKMIRREILVKNRIEFQNLPRSNDIYFSYAAALCSDKIVFTNKVLYYARTERSHSITSTWRGKKNFDCEAFDAIYDFLKRIGCHELLWKSFTGKILKDIFIDIGNFSEQYKKETIARLKEIYFPKWGIPERYEQDRLTAVQKRMVDIIIRDEDIPPYFTILLSCSDLKIKQLIADLHKENKKIVWWGAGKKGLEFLLHIQKINQKIDYVVDSDTDKQGTEAAGYTVLDWESVQDAADVILVVSDAWISDIRIKTGDEKEILNIISYLE